MKIQSSFLLGGLALALFAISVPAAIPYQGVLAVQGVPANGRFDFRFKLFADESGAQQIGHPSLTESRCITNGLFEVILDFGSDDYSGGQYWLEMGVRTNGASSYSLLSPRQMLMPAPQAVFAASASNLLGSVSAHQLIGTVSVTNLPGSLSSLDEVAANSFVGDGANLVNLAASNLTGTIGSEQLGDGSISTNKIDADFYALINGAGAVAQSVVAAALASGTNLIAASGIVNTGVISTKSNPEEVREGNAFLGHGGVGLSMQEFGAHSVSNANWRQGVQFFPVGWDGVVPPPGEEILAEAAIRCFTNWGYSQTLPTLHIYSRGAIRLETGFGATSNFGTSDNYLVLGNEDSNSRIQVNYCQHSTFDSGLPLDNADGYSLPLELWSVGKRGGSTMFASPGIQGYFAGTNSGSSGGQGAYDELYMGELHFFSRVPKGDRSDSTFGREQPLHAVETGRMLTNGWKLNGPQLRELSSSFAVEPNVVIDLNSAFARTISLVSSATNYITVTNLNVYGGATNYQSAVIRILSGSFDKKIAWPEQWTVVSADGSAALPSVLPAHRVLRLELESWGDGEANLLARFELGNDHSFAYDSNADAYFEMAGITNAVLMTAVDYFVKALKSENLWTNCVAIYPFVGEDAMAHAVNLKDPTTFPLAFSQSGINHDAEGITGDGLTGWADTGINLVSTLGPQGMTNCHLIVYCRTVAPLDRGRFVGCGDDEARIGLVALNGNHGYDGPMNLDTGHVAEDVAGDFRGFLGISRPAIDHQFYTAAAGQITPRSSPAEGIPAASVVLLARNIDGNIDRFSDANLAYASIGWGYTPTQLARVREIVNQFQLLLGRNVP